MDVRQAISTAFGQADTISLAYLDDLKPEELLFRPTPKANHIAWQVGHLIVSERHLIDKAVPGRMDALPEEFVANHKKDKATSDDKALFATKEEYIRLAKQVRANSLRVLSFVSTGDLDRPITQGVPPFLKTVGEVFLFIPTHWLMHAGQWAVIRRELGRPPLF